MVHLCGFSEHSVVVLKCSFSQIGLLSRYSRPYIFIVNQHVIHSHTLALQGPQCCIVLSGALTNTNINTTQLLFRCLVFGEGL